MHETCITPTYIYIRKYLGTYTTKYTETAYASFKNILEGHWYEYEVSMVPIWKGGKTQTPSSYRTICLLKLATKLCENIIETRLEQDNIQNKGRLSDKQNGFQREDRSSVV